MGDKKAANVKDKIDNAFKKIESFMCANKLALNTDKTHIMAVATRARHRANGFKHFGISLKTSKEEIFPTNEEKLLGGWLLNDLSWSKQIDKLCGTLSQKITALRRVSHYASFSTRKMIANGLVLSNLSYLLPLWINGNKGDIQKIQVQQNRAARLVTKKSIRTPIEELLREIGWLSVNQLGAYFSVMQLVKVKRTKKPDYLYSRISNKQNIITRRGDLAILPPKPAKKDVASRVFMRKAIDLYNRIPSEKIQEDISIGCIKANVKEWISKNIPIYREW